MYLIRRDAFEGSQGDHLVAYSATRLIDISLQFMQHKDGSCVATGGVLRNSREDQAMTIRASTLARQPTALLARRLHRDPDCTTTIDALERKGKGDLVRQIRAGEYEDRQLTGIGGPALAARAYALDRDLVTGDQVKGGIA
jgi:hypothetical protein